MANVGKKGLNNVKWIWNSKLECKKFLGYPKALVIGVFIATWLIFTSRQSDQWIEPWKLLLLVYIFVGEYGRIARAEKVKNRNHMMIIASVVIKMHCVIPACINAIVHMNCF
jgi:hypothetical protein